MKVCLARHFLPVMVIGALALHPASALAADIVVSSFDDVVNENDGTCTLREAVRSANGDVAIDACEQGDGTDRILLVAGTYTLDLVSGTGEDNALDGDLDLLGPLEIRGVSADYTVIDGVAEQSTERVLHAVGGTAPVVIRNLRITGGNAELGGAIRVESAASMTLLDVAVDGAEAEDGGGIFNGGTLALVRATIESNKASDNGGGIATIGTFSASDTLVIGNVAGQRGGGVASQDGGTVTVERSTIIDNEAGLVGGGLWISFIDEFDLLYSRVEGNRAAEGGGLFVEGDSTYQVLHSALIANAASAQGGGLHGSGIVFVRHSTVALNTAPEGGGGGAYSSGDNVLFDSATISGNTGGGVFNDSGAVFEYSILADNDGGNCLGVEPVAGKLNIDDGNTCRFAANNPNGSQFVDTDPMLGPLADNNGTTPTFALLPGSPAIDAITPDDKPNCGPEMVTGPPPPDQRGYPRGFPPSDINGQPVYLCDIGAYEAHAPYVVDSMSDEADSSVDDGRCLTINDTCTLRAAVQQANETPGLEEIELPAGTFPLTLPGADEDEAATGDLDLLEAVIVRGAGSGQTVVDAEGDRAFDVLPPANIDLIPQVYHLRDLAITGGEVGAAGGGGLRINDRSVHLERTVLSANTSSASGGGIRCESGCVLTMTDSRLVGNSASFGGAVATPLDDPGLVLIERSELSGNTATEGGGALAVADLTLRNSTVSDNHALGGVAPGRGGGVRMRFGVIENSTIVDNSTVGEVASGVYLSIFGTARNSVVARNTNGRGSTNNCDFGTVQAIARFSSGHNVADGHGECAFDRSTDLPPTDPLLGALAGNDGLTRTHALLPSSPAIDAGDDESCPLTDQRGFFRPEDGDGDGTATCDIGAFEALGADLAIAISDSPDPAVVDDEVTYTITITNNGPGAATGVQVSASLPAELSFVSVDAGAANCSESGGTVECAAGDLPAAETVEATIVATASQSGSVSVTASVKAAEADATPADNGVSETTTVNAGAGGSGPGGPDGPGGGGSGGGALAPLLVAAMGLALLFGRLRVDRRRLSTGQARHPR